VVEDDSRINALIKHSLEMDGFEHIQTFLSGLKAELWLQKYCPKLVILDINLPGMSGLEVARSLRQAHESCQPRIVFLTAHPLSNDQEGQELADVYLMKPFNPLQLTQLVRRLLQANKVTPDT
jgi:DNA-binding response OmpR family regulator